SPARAPRRPRAWSLPRRTTFRPITRAGDAIMRSIRAVVLSLVIALPGAARLAAQSEDSFRWYVGAQGGLFGFATRQQDRTWIPSVGGALLVVAKKTGLLVSID